MDNESTAADPYAAVIADLKAQRAKIDQTIELLEGLRAGGVRQGGIDPSNMNRAATGVLGPGAFLGMTIVDAVKKLLAHERRQMGNVEIADALRRGGLVLKSDQPANTVGSVMTRRAHQVGDVVKVGRGVWGLKEWYPNRSFNKPTAKGTESVTPATNEDDPFGDVLGNDAANLDDEIPF